MGGSGASLGVLSTSKLTGTRSSAKERKGQVNAETELILRDLKATPALQFVIRRDFSKGRTLIELDAGGFSRPGVNMEQVTVSVSSAETSLQNQLKASRALQRATVKSSGTWAVYERALAQEKAIRQALKTLGNIKKKAGGK